MIGRDALLKKQLLPRLRSNHGFVLVGQHGIGKTALLEWSFDNAEGKKALVSATWSPKDIFKEICRSWELEVTNPDGEPMPVSKWQMQWMIDAILAEQGHWIFIDDIQRMTPAVIQKMKPIRDRCMIAATAVPPIRKEELKRMLWGIKNIDIKPINKTDMMRIAQEASVKLGSSTPVIDAVHSSRGIPAHLFHALRGEVVQESYKTKDEEIDISPILLIVLAGIMVMRYVARGIDSQSMYLLSGVAMAGGVIFRFYLFRGMKK